MGSSEGQMESSNDDDVFTGMWKRDPVYRELCYMALTMQRLLVMLPDVSHLERTIWGLFCAASRIFPSTFGIS